MKERQGLVQINIRVTPEERERLYAYAWSIDSTVSDVLKEFIHSLPKVDRPSKARKTAGLEMHAAF